DAERDLRDVDQVGGVLLAAAGQPGGRGQPAGVAAHDLGDGDRLEGVHRLVVAARLHDAGGQVLGGAAVAGAVVGARQVVMHGLGHADDAQFVPLPGGEAVEAGGGLHRLVAADEEEVADVVGAADVEQALV